MNIDRRKVLLASVSFCILLTGCNAKPNDADAEALERHALEIAYKPESVLDHSFQLAELDLGVLNVDKNGNILDDGVEYEVIAIKDSWFAQYASRGFLEQLGASQENTIRELYRDIRIYLELDQLINPVMVGDTRNSLKTSLSALNDQSLLLEERIPMLPQNENVEGWIPFGMYVSLFEGQDQWERNLLLAAQWLQKEGNTKWSRSNRTEEQEQAEQQYYSLLFNQYITKEEREIVLLQAQSVEDLETLYLDDGYEHEAALKFVSDFFSSLVYHLEFMDLTELTLQESTDGENSYISVIKSETEQSSQKTNADEDESHEDVENHDDSQNVSNETDQVTQGAQADLDREADENEEEYIRMKEAGLLPEEEEEEEGRFTPNMNE